MEDSLLQGVDLSGLKDFVPLDVDTNQPTVPPSGGLNVLQSVTSLDSCLSSPAAAASKSLDSGNVDMETEFPTPDVMPLQVTAPKEDAPICTVSATATTSTITTPSIPPEEKREEEVEEEKPIKFGKIADAHELGCCEFCGGPVKRRRICSALKRFCSKNCSKASLKKSKKIKELVDDNPQDSDDGSTAAGAEGETSSKITWSDYMEAALSKAAPDCCFKHTTMEVPGLKPGMKLEAVDRNNPPSFCVATVIQQVGQRVRIRYDGFGKDSSNDCWCNFQAEELHPIGWCAQNGYPLQPPKGINSTLEDWRTFLTQTLTGALAAPHDLFRKTQEHFQPRVHGFEVGMKLEAVHPLKPSIICPATVTKSLGPYYFAITPDYQEDVAIVTFCCHSDSPGIFPVGWCVRNSVELTVPASYTKKSFSWEKYLSLCRAPAAPGQLFRKMKAHKFKVGMKVEAVDLEQSQIIRVATITNVMGRMLQLFFDGQSRFQFVDVETSDIYPIGWCKRTGHVLNSPYGPIPSSALSSSEEDDTLDLPSFLEVMGRQNQPQGQPAVGLLPRKAPPVSRIEKDDKSAGEESDISDDDTGSERFYHNKNQIFFNKSCCFGPLLDRDKVAQLPEATPPGKVSSVIRTGLEMVAKAAFDPEKVIDLMQEGCGVRVVVKYKGKILKKAISRVDSRPKLERYLKRFCRRLICCEFFLSLKPVPTPCPDHCQADDQGNLQGPKGLKAKRSREYFEVKHLGVEKKKRGRKRKSDHLLAGDPNLVVTRPLLENGLPIAGATFNVVQGQKTTITTAIAHVQNGAAVSQPIVPGNVGNVRFQVPGNVTVARPPSVGSGGAVFTPQGVVPMGHPPRAAVPINALPGGKPVMKEGVQPHNPSGGPNVLSAEATSRIVTNVSSQRFATSATSSGTTITFGRAPPNVTISNCIPPPLTKIMSEANSGHTATTTNVTVEPHNQLPIHAVSAVQTASVSIPPPLTSGSGHMPPVSRSSFGTASAGNVPMSPGYRQATSPPLLPRQVLSANPGAMIRHPGVHPNPGGTSPPLQVKQNSSTPPPPPPLVPNARVGPQQVRSQGMYPPPQTSSGPLQQPRPGLHSLPTSYTSLGPRSSVVNHHPQVRNPPPLSSSPGSAGGPLHSGMGERGMPHHPGATTMSHRPIMPNYHGMSRSMNPGVPRGSVPPSMRFAGVRGPFGGGSPRYPPNPRLQSGQPVQVSSGQQQSFKVNFTVPTISGNVQRSVAPNPSGSFMDFAPVSKAHTVLTPIQPKSTIEHLRALASASEKEPKIDEGAPKTKDGIKQEPVDEQDDNEEKTEAPRKRNLWWLKKRRRKRSRLTYIKAKYRRKDDEGAPSTSEAPPVEDESESDLLAKSLGDRPKRGRPPKGVPFRLKEESFSNSDPDWDETEERRRVKPVIKKRKGRAKKDSTEATSPKLQEPGFSESLQIPMIPDMPMPMMREVGTRLVATLPSASLSPVGRSPPVSARPVQRSQQGVGAAPRDKRVTSPKGPMPKLVRMSSGSESRGSAARTSPYPSPTSNISVAPLSPQGRRFRPKPLCVDVGTNTSLPGCVNGRSPDLPANPVTWSVEHVVRYVRSTDCFNYANIFFDQEIDGQALMLLSRDSLMQFTRMKLGPTLKMCSYIAQLKLRAR